MVTDNVFLCCINTNLFFHITNTSNDLTPVNQLFFENAVSPCQIMTDDVKKAWKKA